MRHITQFLLRFIMHIRKDQRSSDKKKPFKNFWFDSVSQTHLVTGPFLKTYWLLITSGTDFQMGFPNEHYSLKHDWILPQDVIILSCKVWAPTPSYSSWDIRGASRNKETKSDNTFKVSFHCDSLWFWFSEDITQTCFWDNVGSGQRCLVGRGVRYLKTYFHVGTNHRSLILCHYISVISMWQAQGVSPGEPKTQG